MISIAPKLGRQDAPPRTPARAPVMAPRARVRRAAALPAFAVVATLWLAFWSYDFTYVRTTPLSRRLALRERVLADRSPFSLAGGHGAFFALPLPSRVDRVRAQTILRNGAEVYRIRVQDPDDPETRDLPAAVASHPSPNERFVALQGRGGGERLPLEILDVATRRVVVVAVPESLVVRSGSRYPFELLGWSADSRRVVLARDAMEPDALGRHGSFRELWGVKPDDGSMTLEARCEAPTELDYWDREWDRHMDGTACAAPR